MENIKENWPSFPVCQLPRSETERLILPAHKEMERGQGRLHSDVHALSEWSPLCDPSALHTKLLLYVPTFLP